MMTPDHISTDKRADPARIRLRRRIEWIDTDAAGIYHWTTVCRLAEAAEAELHTSLGIADITFGATPRVAVALDFRRPLRFNDKVEVDLRVDSVGLSSITYALVVTGPQGVAAEGRITACLVEQQGSARPWPPELRGPLTTGGLQESWREDDAVTAE